MEGNGWNRHPDVQHCHQVLGFFPDLSSAFYNVSFVLSLLPAGALPPAMQAMCFLAQFQQEKRSFCPAFWARILKFPLTDSLRSHAYPWTSDHDPRIKGVDWCKSDRVHSWTWDGVSFPLRPTKLLLLSGSGNRWENGCWLDNHKVLYNVSPSS